ncbi:hypothetical protein B0H17DRAFT_1151007 [Mycena rosella]|uniref:Uncharacterized protein n=1 Tax=Mycena rosella TaxID=1033263 RepID=A0AAD7FIN9_MYCRO|nr:hypothetical protein B0H17DRAFT_1151007 [Mycena rosella]
MSRLGNFHQVGWGGCWDKGLPDSDTTANVWIGKFSPNWLRRMWLCGAVIDTAVSRAGYLATERAQRAAGLPQNYRNRTPDTSVTGDIGGDAQEYCWGGPGIFGGPHREKKTGTWGAPTLGGWAPPMILDRYGGCPKCYDVDHIPIRNSEFVQTILNTRAMSVKREAEGWAYDMLVEENPDGATEVIWAVSDSVGGAGAGGDGDEGCEHRQAGELESGMVEAVLAWCQKNPACLEFVTPSPPEGELLVFSASLIFLRTV